MANLADWCVVSAPGKVLVTGGYLVLDREFEGMPVATDSRFYACIKSAGAAKSTGDILGRIIVVSPQFASAEWSYDVQDSGEGKLLGLVPTGSSKNPYLANALIFSLSLASAYPGFREKLASGLKIVVLGGNDFYSQATNLESRGLPRTASGLAQIEPFAQLGPLSGVAKTGLGSSAALVTSVVLAVLSYFGTISLSGPTAEKGRRVGHATAQLAHCLAQGKVGSGFDVASAVYGSGVYRRFDPEVVARLIKQHESNTLSLPTLVSTLNPPSPESDPWNHTHTPIRLPPGLILLLADISAGSETPGMVSKVLAWRAKKPEEANAVWERINKANTKIWALFAELDAIAAEDLAAYEKDLAMAAAQPLASLEKSTPTLSALADVFATCQALRADLRLMSSLADVPVEPPEQTVLLDATMACNGVVAAAVPGAGGMDAIYAVAIAGDAEKGVERMWQSRGGVCAMLSREGKGGARVEAVEDVKGLVDQLQGL